jgi:hypothetical protein
MIINTEALPEQLFLLIKTEKVKVREIDGEVRLIPIRETDSDCPLYGVLSDGKLSSDRFMANKRLEKELDL